MPSSLNHSRLPTTFSSLPRKASNYNDHQKYLVVDSEQQEEKYCRNESVNDDNMVSIDVSYNRQSVIRKSRSGSHSNFFSHQLYPQSGCIELQISQTQSQIQKLQKQCKLLETLINDMAVQQANLLVHIRTNQRRINYQAQQEKMMTRKECPIHRPKINEIENQQLYIKKQYNQCEGIQSIKQQINITTPLVSRNMNVTQAKNLDEIKTIDINNQITKNNQSKIVRAVKKQQKSVQKNQKDIPKAPTVCRNSKLRR